MNNKPNPSLQTRTQLLWLVMLFGLTLHTLLELLPLFFVDSIAVPSPDTGMEEVITWITLIIYVVPLSLVILTLYKGSQWVRLLQLIFAGLFLLLNLVHPLELLESASLPWHHLLIMLFNIIVSGFIVRDAWLWFRQL